MSIENKLLIIGYGTVGKNLHKELKRYTDRGLVDITDKYKRIAAVGEKHSIGFVCVDTPLIDESDCRVLDTTEVKNAILENECELYVIKSTCPVGTVDRLIAETGKRIVFSPEYYGGTQHCNNFVFDFTIVGGQKEDCKKVVQLFQYVYDGRHKFVMTDAKTAEMVKFMENSWLATKVDFCCSFAKAADEFGVDYEELRELFLLDPRVNPSHTFVYRDKPYFDSHCLNKDVPAFAEQAQNAFMQAVVAYNETRKTEFDK